MILKISKKRFRSRQSKERCLLNSLNPVRICNSFLRFTNSITLNNLLIKFPKNSMLVANRIIIICTTKTLLLNRLNLKIMRSITSIIRTLNRLRYIIAVILFTPEDFWIFQVIINWVNTTQHQTTIQMQQAPTSLNILTLSTTSSLLKVSITMWTQICLETITISRMDLTRVTTAIIETTFS